MALHGLIDIKGLETGSVKAGEPHVPDNDDLQFIVRIFHAFSEFSSLFFRRMVPSYQRAF